MISGMTLIVKKISQLMIPSIFLLGIYVVFHGHLSPGGGFAGGILIAGSFVLAVLSNGKGKTGEILLKARASSYECLGLIFFWFLGILGLMQGGIYFLNVISKNNTGQLYHLFSGGIIPLCNIAIGIEVAAALFTIFFTLAVLKIGDNR